MDPTLEKIKLHRPPIATREVRLDRAAAPDIRLYPKGGYCCWCDKDNLILVEMWPIEFQYKVEDGHTLSMYVYACSEKHAAEYMLNWWDGPDLTLADWFPQPRRG